MVALRTELSQDVHIHRMKMHYLLIVMIPLPFYILGCMDILSPSVTTNPCHLYVQFIRTNSPGLERNLVVPQGELELWQRPRQRHQIAQLSMQ
jgi:hypothetical protein